MASLPHCECAICMVELCGTSGQGCSNNHLFHVVCILEWLKASWCTVFQRLISLAGTKLSVMREQIKSVTVNELGCGRSVIELPQAANHSAEIADGIDLESIICEVCNRGDDEAHLLLCDMCDQCYHMSCLSPPLSVIPEAYWYCTSCEQERSTQEASAAQQNSRQIRRQITRTALSHNVRRSLRTIVDPDAEESDYSSDDSESEDGEEIEENDEENDEHEDFENDVEQDDFVLDALDQPGPSNRPVPRIPTRRARRTAKRSKRTRKITARGKLKKKRRKSRRSTKKRSTRSRSGYGSVYKRLAEAMNVNLRKSNCYNVTSSSERGRARLEPIGGTLNLVQAGTDEYVSDNDSDDFELSSAARRFDRPLMRRPLEHPKPVQQEIKPGSTSSVGLLDQILENQTRILAPSSLLKIRRDGTLEERQEMKEYRKLVQDRLCNHPAFEKKRSSTDIENTKMSFRNDNPSTSLATMTVLSNGGSPKKSRWGPAQSRSTTLKNDIKASSSLATSRLATLPPRPSPLFPAQLQGNPSLLSMQPFLAVSLADAMSAPPPPPPPVIQQGNFLPHQFMPQMFSSIMPSSAGAGIDPTLLGILSGATAPNVPFTVGNLSSIPMPVAPPPPPPVLMYPPQTTTKSSHVKTNDDSLTEMDISPETSGREKDGKKENGHSEEADKTRLRTDADREMKKALTPYFRNKKITKDEYKTLMKRGVYKLVKKGRPVTSEAATRLAMNYVFELTEHR